MSAVALAFDAEGRCQSSARQGRGPLRLQINRRVDHESRPTRRKLPVTLGRRQDGLRPGNSGDHILTHWRRLAYRGCAKRLIRRRAGKELGEMAIRLVRFPKDLTLRPVAVREVREGSVLSWVTNRLGLERLPVFVEPSSALADSRRRHAEQACRGTSLLS
jgi:hypothetical protein